MRVLGGLLVTLVLASCSEPPAETGQENLGEESAPLYARLCSTCHGPSGEGTSIGPQVRSPVRDYAAWVTRNGRPNEMGYAGPMPALGPDVLTDAELDDMLTWLGGPPRPSTGEGLFVRYCANCHGPDARGGRVEEDLTHEVREEEDEILEAVREGHGDDDYGDRKEFMPSWSESELSGADVAAIIAYVRELPPAPEDEERDED